MPNINLINDDCMNVMKGYPDNHFDLAIVDPPYGIGAGSKSFINRNTANKKAIDAINGYAAFLEKEKLPKANNNYAIGKENYQKIISNIYMIKKKEKKGNIMIYYVKKDYDDDKLSKIMNTKIKLFR